MAAGFAQPSGALTQFGGANNHPHDGWSQTFWRSQRPFSNNLPLAGAVCGGGLRWWRADGCEDLQVGGFACLKAGRGGFRCGWLAVGVANHFTLTSLRLDSPASGRVQSTNSPISNTACLNAGRGGFRCGCLRLALPTTSHSPRLGSTLPQAGEFSQRILPSAKPVVSRPAGEGFAVAACGWRCQPLHTHLANARLSRKRESSVNEFSHQQHRLPQWLAAHGDAGPIWIQSWQQNRVGNTLP
ncbi:hypothetical protein SV7mr_08510 [Stieleria bergensis]|uniref:Uncharacterized protein n=1 Tax=Stieleria bergensis TaxID=2528025 RepID=A0A517SQG4_9BACT|nr:hypothetical protein SV7mr_08510 [Planctomycetes bacterium SV_7m_r]